MFPKVIVGNVLSMPILFLFADNRLQTIFPLIKEYVHHYFPTYTFFNHRFKITDLFYWSIVKLEPIIIHLRVEISPIVLPIVAHQPSQHKLSTLAIVDAHFHDSSDINSGRNCIIHRFEVILVPLALLAVLKRNRVDLRQLKEPSRLVLHRDIALGTYGLFTILKTLFTFIHCQLS